MKYESVDPVFGEWAKRHGLEVFTRYHETDVRTVFMQGANSERGQIWIDPPASDGAVAVHVAVYRNRGRDNQKSDLLAERDSLDAVLDEAYALIAGWLAISS